MCSCKKLVIDSRLFLFLITGFPSGVPENNSAFFSEHSQCRLHRISVARIHVPQGGHGEEQGGGSAVHAGRGEVRQPGHHPDPQSGLPQDSQEVQNAR